MPAPQFVGYTTMKIHDLRVYHGIPDNAVILG